MRVAVTGSTGLIGCALMQRLKSAGHQTVPVLRSASASSSQESSQQAVMWNPASGDIDAAGLEGCDAVVHLAGEPIASQRWTQAQKQRIADSRTQSTALLAATLTKLDAPPKVLVSGSAIGFYGNRGDEVLDESSSGGDDFLATVCRDWEAAADPARAAGIRVVHPRTGVVLSKLGGALAEMLPFFKLGIGGRIGNGQQWMSWITLHDEVEALLWLLQADQADQADLTDLEGPVNLTAPQPVTNSELTRALGQALRRPTLLPVPKPALRARLGSELADALLYSSARVQPSRLIASGFTFSHSDIATALKTVLA